MIRAFAAAAALCLATAARAEDPSGSCAAPEEKPIAVAPARPTFVPAPEAARVAEAPRVPELAAEAEGQVMESRRRTGTFLVGSGFAMLAVSAGMALYSGTQGSPAAPRAALSASTPPSSGGPSPAGIAALALAASGAGAIAAGGLVLALMPDGVAIRSRF